MPPKLRASYAPIWSKCSASIGLKQLELPATPESIEGEAVHLMAFRRAQENTCESGIKTVVTEEMRDAAQGFVDYCNDLECDLKAREITFGGDIMPEEVGGTADFIGYDTDNHILHVVDLKYGYSSVRANDNAQLLVYSLGAVGYFKQKETLKIKLHIYQPRDYIGGIIKVWTLGVVDWDEVISELKGQAGAALFNSLANTGEHCRYCKSRVYCPAFLNSASNVLETVLTQPESLELSEETIAVEYQYLLRAESLAKSARKGFEDLITQRIESGGIIPGWTIGSTKGRYKWAADTETLKSVGELYGIKLTEEKPILLGTVRKDPLTRDIVKTLITKTNGTKTLVPFDESVIEEVFNG